MPGLGIVGAAPAAAASVHDLGVVGYWNQVVEPRCARYLGKTYAAFLRSDRHIFAMEIASATRTAATPYDFGASDVSPDGTLHNAGCLIVRDSDKRILVAESSDAASEQPATWLSTNAADATAFGSVALIPPSVSEPTYSILAQLTAIAGQPIYYFVRIYDSGLSTFFTGYYKSTDGGATWSSFQRLLKPVTTNAQYHTIFTNGTRVDIFTTDTNRTLANPSSVYHMYLDDADNLHKSDGTLIGAASAGPYFANTGTLVKGTSEGPARTDGWGYDASGHPAALIVVNSGGTDSLVRVGRWSGSAWSVHNVCAAGGIVSSNVFQTSGAMAHDDPNTVYTPQKVSTKFEMFAYTSANDGTTWTGTQLTTSSSGDNLLPACPTDADPLLRVIWPQGTYTDDSTFTCTFKAYG